MKQALKEAQFRRIAQALADPTRFDILSRIARAGELACADLTRETAVTPATVSHHVKELGDAGLIARRKEGKFYFYRLKPGSWAGYLRELARRIPAS